MTFQPILREMKDDAIQQRVKPTAAALRCLTSPPHRVLVVDDELCMRQLNTKMLIDAGYHADAAEDGAVAWDTLQVKHYDLLITDHFMPKVSGIELIKKVRAARMVLPIIMATGTSPEHKYAQHPQIKPAAVLLKPYTVSQFLETVKTVLCAAAFVIMFLLFLPTAGNAQDSTDQPNAVTLSVHGKCDCSEVRDLIELDELQAVSEKLTAQEPVP